MKVRGSGKPARKVEQQMTPMIDVVFQLLIFFILTLKIIPPEGDFNINMPVGATSEQQDKAKQFPDIKVHLVAGPGGELQDLMLGQRRLGNDRRAFDQLNNEILKIIGRPNDPRTEDVEVEIEADYGLHYGYTVQAIGACTGRLDSKGNLVRYIEKIKFAPPVRAGT